MIADFSGSILFLLINVLFFAVWILWNQSWTGSLEFDPYPFGLLTMIVSLEAIFLSIFLLISSNHQAAKDRVAAEVDHQVNTKAEVEVGLVLQRLDDLEQGIYRNHNQECTLIKGLAPYQMPQNNHVGMTETLSQENASNDRPT